MHLSIFRECRKLTFFSYVFFIGKYVGRAVKTDELLAGEWEGTCGK